MSEQAFILPAKLPKYYYSDLKHTGERFWCFKASHCKVLHDACYEVPFTCTYLHAIHQITTQCLAQTCIINNENYQTSYAM